MTPERWQKVNELFHSALKHGPAQRAAFLDHACKGDHELRKEVESLIASGQNSDGSFDAYLFEDAARLLSEDTAELSVGQRIGQYKILSLLGRGGMGEVYLANDSKLGRKVALKLLPASFTQDQERVRRFEQEARAASALNHPNILTIFDVEKMEGTQFIATEYIEGQTLLERLADKKMELSEVLDVAIQVSSALSAAHQAGIAHRDIKPENIMLRPDGYVKVLDFGLAKLSERGVADGDTAPQAFAAVKTDTGVVIGTASYMSPEQAKGRPVDQRSDIFSFGAVFYEMIIGAQAFRGDSNVDTLHAIIHDEPAGLSRLRAKVPSAVYLVLQRCLAKEVEARYDNGTELLDALKRCSSFAISGSHRTVWQGWRRKAGQAGERRDSKKNHVNPLVLFVPIILIGVGVWFLYFRSAPKAILPPLKVIPFTSLPGVELEPSFSPDGSKIAFSWSGGKETINCDIYVKQIEAGNPLRLTTHPAEDRSPVWSPDGNYIAFSRLSETDGGIYIVPSLGGAERKVYSAKWLDTMLHYIDWSPDGKLLAFQVRDSPNESSSIFLLSLDTLEKRKLTSPPEQHWYGDWHPVFSTDGQTLAFLRDSSIATEDVYVVSISGGEPRRMTFDNTGIGGLAWTNDGSHIVFTSNRGGDADLRFWILSV
jgi:eukaryotic-like serine/threonine-protein kinase